MVGSGWFVCWGVPSSGGVTGFCALAQQAPLPWGEGLGERAFVRRTNHIRRNKRISVYVWWVYVFARWAASFWSSAAYSSRFRRSTSVRTAGFFSSCAISSSWVSSFSLFMSVVYCCRCTVCFYPLPFRYLPPQAGEEIFLCQSVNPVVVPLNRVSGTQVLSRLAGFSFVAICIIKSLKVGFHIHFLKILIRGS